VAYLATVETSADRRCGEGRLLLPTANFDGKRILVTGASRGIGRAVAEGFLHEGATVYILAHSDAIFDAARALADEHGQRVHAIQCDISDAQEVADRLAGIRSLDVLVNNAGLELSTPIDDGGSDVESRFRRIIDTNVLGTYFVTRSCVSRMAPGSRIVITSSIWGKTAVAEFSAYCASKHANLGFMRSLAKELAPRQITVNAVCPGWVRTEAAMRSLREIAQKTGQSEAEALDKIVANQAISGLLEPEDVVGPYLFLAGDSARDITGQTINIDRGEVMT